MRFVVLCGFACLFSFSSFSQSLDKSLKSLLESVKDKSQIAVEGYYVDSSSFMVLRSSDSKVRENTRYPVYEYKYQDRLYSKTPEGKAEISVLMRSGARGKKRSRILLVDKVRSNGHQLVVDEATAIGLPIVDDRVEYIGTYGDVVDWVSLEGFRDFVFNNGVMPQINEK